MGHELINIHLGTDDSPFVVRPWSSQLSSSQRPGTVHTVILSSGSKKKKIYVKMSESTCWEDVWTLRHQNLIGKFIV